MYRFNENLGMNNFGSILWENAGCLLLIYIICYFSMWKGVQTSGKVKIFLKISNFFVLIFILSGSLVYSFGSLCGFDNSGNQSSVFNRIS